MRGNKEIKAVTVRHILCNGQEVKSIEGKCIPVDHPFYDFYAKAILDLVDKQQSSENSVKGA